MAAPPAPYDESPVKPPSMLLAALRRWPLLVLGAAVGLLAGFFVFTTQAPQYQSAAKVLVIKQRVEQLSTTDSRSAYVDDYVQTQIPLIKSDLILIAASKRPELSQLTQPLPENPNVAASVLLAGLTVARDKEAAAGAQGGSNILLMSFRSKNARDSYLLLQAVIEAYRRELSDVYAGQTKKQIKALESRIEAHNKSIEQESERHASLARDLLDITGEDLAVVRTRVSAGREREFALEVELKDLEDQLELIKTSGPNRRDRLAVLTLLGVPKKVGAEVGTATPEARLQMLQAERMELSERLGKDHPQMKALDTQIGFFQKLLEDQNPDDPLGTLDELAQLERQLERRRKTAKAQMEVIGKRYRDDEDKLKRGGDLAVQIEIVKSRIAEETKRMSDRQLEVNALRPSESAGGYEASVITPPQEGIKVGTGLISWLMAGGVLGALAGIGLAMLAELTDKSFRSAAEIRQRLGAPVFGHLPPINTKLLRDANAAADYDPTLVVALRPKSVESEAYRGVRAQLLVSTHDKGHQVIQVTSPNPGDGKSTLAANLAISIAQAGKTVVLLDCDFRKPRVHKLFNIPRPDLGLASVTNGQTELSTAIRHSEIDRLDLLPCGPRPANPAELLSSLKFQEVLAELRTRYDYVIVDTPPMLAVSDPRVVAQRVDGVLLVLKVTKKARPQAERAREQLADMGANLLGVVVNGAGGLDDQYGYKYGYKYQYSYDYEYAQSYADDVPSGEFIVGK